MFCLITPAITPGQRWIVAAVAGVLLVLAHPMLGAEGYMVNVTATPGKIMERDKVLAEVPAGTRLWVFNVSADKQWVEVKVPNGEQHGWLLEKSTAAIKLTERQQEQLQQAYKIYEEYEGLVKENKAKDALAQLEKSLQLLREVRGNDHPEVARVLSHLGSLAATQGDLRLSRQSFDEALPVSRKYLGSASLDVGNTLFNLGELATKQERYAEARESYSEALTIYQKNDAKNVSGIGETLLRLGDLSRQLLDDPAAKKYYDEALRTFRQQPEGRRVAECLARLGLLAAAESDYPAAKKAYAEALAICRKTNDKFGTAELLSYLGTLQRSEGDDANAQQSFEEALRLYRTEQYHDKTIATLRALGEIAMYSYQDYPVAKKYFEEAMALSEQHFGREDARLSEGHRLLGALFRFQGNFPLAQEHLERALKIAREHELKTILPNVLNSLAVLADQREDFPRAKQYYEEAITASRAVQHEKTTALLLRNLGSYHILHGDFAAARKCLDESLAIQRTAVIQHQEHLFNTLHTLGDLSFALKDYRAAWQQYDEVLTGYRRLFGEEHPKVAEPLKSLATLAVVEEDHDLAIRRFDRVQRIERHYLQYILPTLAANEQLYFLEANHSISWLNTLAYGFTKPQDASVINATAAWLINGKSVAQESLSERELLARDLTNPKLAPLVQELQSLRERLGSLSLTASKPEAAAVQQAKLLQLSSDEYRLTQALTQAAGTSLPARDWIEVEHVRRKLPAGSLYVDLLRLEPIDFSVFNAKKGQNKPHYAAWLVPAHGRGEVRFVDLGPAAPIDAAVEQARHALAQTASSQGPLKQAGEAAAAAQVTVDLKIVAELVLKPLLPHLAQKTELILSPDGALWLLPWAALPVGEDQILLERCSIRYVLSGRDLVKKSGSSKLETTAPAIIVNPNYDLSGSALKAALRGVLPGLKLEDNSTRGETSRSSLPHVAGLPFTSAEGTAAKASLEQLSKSAPLFYEQDQALEAVVKNLKRPKHLLLSTHGFFLPDQERHEPAGKLLPSNDTRSLPALTKEGQPIENPLLRCGLLLAGCNATRTPGLDDGILTGLEIVGLDLRGTELVVLSACETGIGKVRNGEGVAGLRQAFQLAGAQSVVSTLWQVPDRDSALIMQDFFTNLAAGQTKADALRNAQLKRIAARKEKSGVAHPFFWAAWTVTGE